MFLLETFSSEGKSLQITIFLKGTLFRRTFSSEWNSYQETFVSDENVSSETLASSERALLEWNSEFDSKWITEEVTANSKRRGRKHGVGPYKWPTKKMRLHHRSNDIRWAARVPGRNGRSEAQWNLNIPNIRPSGQYYFQFLISFMLCIQPQHGSYPLLFLRRFKHTSVLAGASRIAEQDRRRFLCL